MIIRIPPLPEVRRDLEDLRTPSLPRPADTPVHDTHRQPTQHNDMYPLRTQRTACTFIAQNLMPSCYVCGFLQTIRFRYDTPRCPNASRYVCNAPIIYMMNLLGWLRRGWLKVP